MCRATLFEEWLRISSHEGSMKCEMSTFFFCVALSTTDKKVVQKINQIYVVYINTYIAFACCGVWRKSSDYVLIGSCSKATNWAPDWFWCQAFIERDKKNVPYFNSERKHPIRTGATTSSAGRRCIREYADLFYVFFYSNAFDIQFASWVYVVVVYSLLF